MPSARPASSVVNEGFELWRSAMAWQLSAAAVQVDQDDAVTQRAIATRAGLDEPTTSRLW